ncbi:MAG: UDP-N-acetylmuramoyl-L-alanyl-D-glutamate--2,6-diaminopimelate ligase, partial [Acidobacteria bacterium]|nr:UDP-N-acetylmuramoyl-L-alanyl-D-glutamate--2,6-diaminopimelate ligase [Acidobacteriota bacterium]
PGGISVPWISATADPRPFLGEISSRIYGRPDRELILAGVTGTNGKTTVSTLLARILTEAGHPAGLVGSLGYSFRECRFDGDRTTPEASDLFRVLRAMRREGAEAVAMEVSSHALELGRVGGALFDVGVFTNLTRDHFDFHGSFEAYYAAKKRLFRQLKTDGAAIVNLRDSFGRRLSAELQQELGGKARRVTYGEGGDLRIEDAVLDPQGIRGHLVFHDAAGDQRISFESPLIGRFNLENLEAAAAAALALEVPFDAVRRAFAAQQPLPGRLELVGRELGLPISVFVDFAHTDQALAAALATVKELVPGPVLVVFGCGGDRDPGKRPLMGRVAGELADIPIVTSDNPRTEDPMKIIAAVEDGLKASGSARYRILPDRREAIRRAIAVAPPGSAVLIAGKGDENVQKIGGQSLPFSDRQEARRALEEHFGSKARG